MSTRTSPEPPPAPERLDSWKEIAAYLKRDIRTVQRWEKEESLPVHRHQHKKAGSVYAHPAELDAWWASRRIHVAEEPTNADRQSGWRWAGAAVLVIALAALGVWTLRPQPRPPERHVTVLAVLPFENLSGDTSQEYLSDGLTEEMIVRLGGMGFSDLRVLGRGSAMAYRGTNKPAADIGRELGADYLLRGSVRRSGERLRVVAQLIRVSDESSVWSQSYNRNVSDFLLVQEDVAAAIAEGIQSNLGARRTQRPRPARAVDPVTYEAYLKGKYFWNKFSWAHMGTAIGYFQQAIARDPEFAEAHAGLAAAYGIYGNFNMEPPRDVYPLARAAAERALALDDRLPEAHIQMGFHHLFYTRDWAESERGFRRALELAPQSAPAHEGYSMYLVVTGQRDAAQREILRARELDPLSLFVNVDVGWVYYFSRDYDRALSNLLEAQRLDPNFPPTYWVLRQAYAVKGMEAESTQALRQMVVSAGGGPSPELERILEILKKQGVVAAKQAWLAQKEKWSRGRYADAYEMAIVNLRAGKIRPALDWLEKGFEDRNFRMAFIQVDPLLDPLRAEPRFQELLQKMKFPPVGDPRVVPAL